MELKNKKRTQLGFYIDDDLYNQYKIILINQKKTNPTADITRFMQRVVNGVETINPIDNGEVAKNNVRQVVMNVKEDLYNDFKNEIIEKRGLSLNSVVVSYIKLVVDKNTKKTVDSQDIDEYESIKRATFYIDDKLYREFKTILLKEKKSISEDLNEYIKNRIEEFNNNM